MTRGRLSFWLASVTLLACLSVQGLAARTLDVAAGQGALQAALASAAPGDVLVLARGDHAGPVTIDRPLVLEGEPGARIVGDGTGSVVTITAPDVTVRGLELTGSGLSHDTMDSGVSVQPEAHRALIENNRLHDNLVGVHLKGPDDAIVRANTIEGRLDLRMNDRGNGVYVWNTPGSRVEGNLIRYGRDGIFVNTSRDNVFADNHFEQLRFAIHYMYCNHSQVTGNVSIGNEIGYALMFSKHLVVENNVSIGDRQHGVMFNYANSSRVAGNYVRGDGGEKCVFLYNSNKNAIIGNWFEACEIGIHFTAGSERNQIADNAFIGNRTQVKYVGSRDLDWSADGRGNYWSDHPAYDLDGDGFADAVYRPNDLVDQIMWREPLAKLLVSSPVVQLLRWAQAEFPALLPGGVIDSAPLMAPVMPDVPPPDVLTSEEVAG